MLDLNSLRVFEKVASLKSFTGAARALGLPKSNISRSIARLEAELGTRLFQRTTRDVVLTLTGAALLDRSTDIINGLSEALDYVGRLGGQPRGTLKISAGIGFGINVLAEQLPEFLKRHPQIDITLYLGAARSAGGFSTRRGEVRRDAALYVRGARLSRTSRHAEVDRRDRAT